MKWKPVLSGVVFLVVFFILVNLIPKSRHSSGIVNYAPAGFKKTIQSSINGIVSATKQEGLFWVTINNKRLPFSYDEYKLPNGWKQSYPKNFIAQGDSIYKAANNDTFYQKEEVKVGFTFYLTKSVFEWALSVRLNSPSNKKPAQNHNFMRVANLRYL